MPTPSTFAVFAVAAIALAVVPGPAVTYIVTQSVDKGRRAGLFWALASRPAARARRSGDRRPLRLDRVLGNSIHRRKLVGAAYLIVVGVRRILARDEEEVGRERRRRARQLYVQGAVVNVLNPKTALFFLAFLPQFVDPDRGSVTLQVAMLGTLFALIALTTDAAYALLSDALAGRMRRSAAGTVPPLVSGGIFVALGISAAAARRADVTRVPLLADTRIVVGEPGPDDVVLRPPVSREHIEDVGAAVREALAFPLAGLPLDEL